MPRRVSLTVFLGLVAMLVLTTSIGAGAAQDDIQTKEAEIASAQDRLMDIRIESGAAQAAYNNALYEMNQLNGEIAAAEDDFEAAKEELAVARASLEERASQVYRSGNVAFMDVLVGVDNFSDFAARLNLWMRLLGQERAEFEAVRDAKKELAAHKDELEARKDRRIAAVEEALAQKERAEEAEAEAEDYLRSLNGDLRAAIQAEQDRQAELAARRATEVVEEAKPQPAPESAPKPAPEPEPESEPAPEPIPEVEVAQVEAPTVPRPNLQDEQAAAARAAAAEEAAAAAERAAERAAEQAAAERASEKAAAKEAAEQRAAEKAAEREDAREQARLAAERAAELQAERRAAREAAEREAERAARQAAIERAAAEQAAAERAAAERAAERRAQRAAEQRAAERKAAEREAARKAAAKVAEREAARQAARADREASASAAADEEASASAEAEKEKRKKQNDASASASASASPSASASASAPSGGGKPSGGGSGDVLAVAQEHMGTPYVFSPPGPCTAFEAEDCSCFTMLVFGEFGISLPDSPGGQMGYGTPVSGAPAAGDLLFWSEDGSGTITHVGIAMGDGTTIHASNYTGNVTITGIDAVPGYVGAERLL